MAGTRTAAEWAHHSRDPSYLYGGSLQAATDTTTRISADPGRHPPLSQTETDFLHASDRAQRRTVRRRRRLIALLTVLVLGLATATALAVRASQQAVHGDQAAEQERAAEALPPAGGERGGPRWAGQDPGHLPRPDMAGSRCPP